MKKNKDLVMDFDIPSENDLIRKYCGQSPEIPQSETALHGKNGFLKTFLTQLCADSVDNF